MRTIITFKADGDKPEETYTYVGLVAIPNLDDAFDLIDYDSNVVVKGIPMKSLKRVVWDEDETEEDGETIRAEVSDEDHSS